MKVLAIIQARTGSTRLPGKVALPLAGRPLIQRVIEAVRAAELVTDVVLAVPEGDHDALAPQAEAAGCRIFAGPEEDVLGRFALASALVASDTIVRATGDNPFVCPEHIDSILRHHAQQGADLSHWLGIPLGSGVEVIRRTALLEAAASARLPCEREHVTPWIYANRDRFCVEEPDLALDPGIRLTVDTREDYARAVRLADFFHQRGMLPVRLGQIFALWETDPALFC